MSHANHNPSATGNATSRRLSLFAAWALAFGCAVGWDAAVLPSSTFLPKAGPAGTILGLLLGALVMGVVAWNFHFMINRRPGPGGIYSYATEAFGSDHGFISAWFLCLTYVAIVWADATALVVVLHQILGDVFRVGFSYSVAGHDVFLGDILLSAAAIAVAAGICCRRVAAAAVQSVLCILFALAVAVCFGAAFSAAPAGCRALEPAFSPLPPVSHPVLQILAIVAISPWLFVGFEAISNLSGEFRFPIGRSFWVMAAAIGAAVVAYSLLAAIPALLPFGGAPDWASGFAALDGREYPAFGVIAAPLGRAARPVLAAALVAAVFTNLVGNTVAASRLLAAMADDGVLPGWLGRKNASGAPGHAILAIALLSVLVSALGGTVIGIIADIAVIGAGIAYSYVSAATLKLARAAGRRFSAASGAAGLLFSLAISVAFVLPNVASDTASMSTPSYLVVVLWCIAGLVFFLSVFRRDSDRRFGQSTVVWIFLLAAILLMSVIWIRQTTYDTTARAFEDIVSHHADVCIPAALDGAAAPSSEDALLHDASDDPSDWRATLRGKLRSVNGSIIRNSLVLLGLIVISFALMICLFAILRRRERDLEREKARTKSYFFSTVSHDIRTPLNAIIGFSEMLKAGISSPAEREQAVDSIIVSGKTLLGLVNDVLDLSKLEAGKMDILPEPTDCPRLLREVLDAFRATAAKPGLELRCRTAPMPLLLLDPQRLRQIVFNIVGNALKFTERGYVELRASFDAPSGLFLLEVEDTGCGMSDEDKRRIGSAYVQVGSKLSRNGGTGLGLAICAQLAAAMGGTLSVVSALGRGSTFSVTIPGVQVADNAAPAARHDSFDGRTDFPDPLPVPVRRILLVDDSKMNLMVLQAHLKHLGSFDIALALDGLQALALLRDPAVPPFDLVFTDLWMPNLDGEGLVRAIRSDPALASLRIVVVTADVELLSSTEPALDFDSILYKPVTSAKLARLLSASL